MSLDDKLLGIIKLIQRDYQKYADAKKAEERIAQIKKAFADEGYTKHNWSIAPGSVEIDGIPHMTGQEFYSRFETELDKAVDDDLWRDETLEAAKRASGISEQKDRG